ncbi:MAG: hypothetical protein RBS34_15360 [Desulfofustis sp.]|jgi:hypothetical protein|nr:hypothetical protein [Desulfofustis sp.]
MRCPKCGFISFDNLEVCASCNKDISEIAKAFQGSTRKVAPPVFLKIASLEEGEDFSLEEGQEAEIEFADPDLEILVDREEVPGEEGGLEFAFGDQEENEDAAIRALDEEFSAATREEGGTAPEGTLDLGMFEDTSDEETFAFTDSGPAKEPPRMEIPEELADISDLSPPEPGKQHAATEPPPLSFDEPETEEAPAITLPAAEPEDDLDFSTLDMDLGLGEDEPAAPAAKTTEKPAPRPGPRMDDDLNFELDLGGLSIHDDK